jgi:hypothetical protein
VARTAELRRHGRSRGDTNVRRPRACQGQCDEGDRAISGGPICRTAVPQPARRSCPASHRDVPDLGVMCRWRFGPRASARSGSAHGRTALPRPPYRDPLLWRSPLRQSLQTHLRRMDTPPDASIRQRLDDRTKALRVCTAGCQPPSPRARPRRPLRSAPCHRAVPSFPPYLGEGPAARRAGARGRSSQRIWSALQPRLGRTEPCHGLSNGDYWPASREIGQEHRSTGSHPRQCGHAS